MPTISSKQQPIPSPEDGGSPLDHLTKGRVKPAHKSEVKKAVPKFKAGASDTPEVTNRAADAGRALHPHARPSSSAPSSLRARGFSFDGNMSQSESPSATFRNRGEIDGDDSEFDSDGSGDISLSSSNRKIDGDGERPAFMRGRELFWNRDPSERRRTSSADSDGPRPPDIDSDDSDDEYYEYALGGTRDNRELPRKLTHHQADHGFQMSGRNNKVTIPKEVSSKIDQSGCDPDVKEMLRNVASDRANGEAGVVFSGEGDAVQQLLKFCLKKNENTKEFLIDQIKEGKNVDINKKEIEGLDDMNLRLSTYYQLNLADAELKADHAHLSELSNRPRKNDDSGRLSALDRSSVEGSIQEVERYKQSLIKEQVKKYNKELGKGKSKISAQVREKLEIIRDTLFLRLSSFQHADKLHEDGEFKSNKSRLDGVQQNLASFRSKLRECERDLASLENKPAKITYGATGSPLSMSAETPGRRELLSKKAELKKEIKEYEKTRNDLVRSLVSEYDHAFLELNRETRGLGKLPPEFKAVTKRLESEREKLLKQLPVRTKMARVWHNLFLGRRQ